MEKEILLQEQSHLKEVQSHIEADLVQEQIALDTQKDEIVKRRKEMWQECAHLARDFDDIVAMNAYDEGIREEQGHYMRKDEIVRQLKYLKNNTYFGRIDFAEEGETDAEAIYIGRYGFRNKRTREYEVYDWRTPIASMFYDNSVGEVFYRCPAGVIRGEVTRKRQYQIEDGELQYCYDTNIAVQDEVLGKVLSENTDKVLRVIIDTITKEQNKAIRQSHGTDLLITGPAGSGKTSVGMHRLAYLLYDNREHLSSEKIVCMSRNQIFSSYISGILPELGEENVGDVTFDSLIHRGITKEFKKKDYYEQVEYLLKHKEETLRKRGIRLKISWDFLEYIREKLKVYTEHKRDFAQALSIYMNLLREYVRTSVNKELADNLVDDFAIYGMTKSNILRNRLYYEDLLLISYIRILIGGIRPMDYISHVVIDEAQDYNRLQLLILKILYPKSRFTILADVNQAISPEVSTIDVEDFYRIFGKGLKEITLNKSYRSTAPINEFAFDIIGIHDPELYVDRPGKPPKIIKDMNPKLALVTLLKRLPSDKSVAILTCDIESAVDLKNKIGASIDDCERKLQYIYKPNETLEEKTVVMPIMLAKGLEYDIVIVWDNKDVLYWEENKNLKYLMCTRALHELYFIKSE